MEFYPGLLFRWAVQGLLALAALTFVIQCLLPRWRKFFKIQQSPRPSETDLRRLENSVDDEKKARMREKLQHDHSQKASSYMDRILIPREEAKRKQKEKEFEKFLGPAWKGKGLPLGGDEQEDVDSSDRNTSQRHQAARRRKLQLSEGDETKSSKNKEPEKKQIIHLPEEPSGGGKDIVTVRLRTPFGTTYQRRFLHTDTVQVLMDYMTTLGFRQTSYTISTSYPRLKLSEYLNKALWEVGLKGQVTLNVEEKDE